LRRQILAHAAAGGEGLSDLALAAIKTLPPHRVVQQMTNGQPVWSHAGPTICGCLYVGNQAAYGRYQASVFQKNIADEQQMTANINSMNDWDWGPWGGYPYPGWYY